MKNFFIVAIVNSLVLIPSTVFSQTHNRIPSEKPKLIVSMVVDQMRYDYIHRY
jgi:predicted AlkP superfamily pyrophosphatase or phosphodiesterase